MSKQNTNHVAKRDNFIYTVLSMVIAIAITTETAIACQPCKSALDFEQSLKKADLVIVGKRIDYDPEEKRPSSIKVEIIKVLKGKIKEARIQVKSWYGMCPYGIVVDDQTYVMILKEPLKMQGVYITVNTGCSFKQLLVKSNMVAVGNKSMSVEDIAEIINMSR